MTALHNSRPQLPHGALNTPTNSISDGSRWEEVTSPHVQITEAIAAHASHGLSHSASLTSANPAAINKRRDKQICINDGKVLSIHGYSYDILIKQFITNDWTFPL